MNVLDLGLSLCAAVWLYLLLARGGFWLCGTRDDGELADPAQWPSVVAIVPARNEAAVIGQSIGSLARQDYPGEFSIIVVDDQSTDATSQLALEAAAEPRGASKILKGRPLASGWTGKLFALQQGFEATEGGTTKPDYIWLTDADIEYLPGALTSLVRRAEAGGLAATSLMVKLRCESLAERALIPAFVFFFQMLYPFAWVNQKGFQHRRWRGRLHAGAARGFGGCRRLRGDPRRADRRLRARRAA